MAEIPRIYIDNLTSAVNGVSESMQASLAEALSAIDYTQDVATIRNQVIEIMQVYCGGATDQAAMLAAEFYDGLREIELGERMGAVANSGRIPEATDGAVRAFAQKLVDGKVEEFVNLCLSRLDYETKVATSQTVLNNGRRDRRGPRYARVPTGAETCDFCLMLSSRGFVYHDAAAASHAHANCVVADTNVSGTGLLASMGREYKGPLIHIVTRADRKLSVTPNHPILTTRGWVSAGEVVESDSLVCANLFDGHDVGVPDVDNEPPTIEQVFKACCFLDTSALDSVPPTTKYLYREMFPECDVKVVNPLGLLERAFVSSGFEPTTHERFTIAGESGTVVSNTLDGDGALDSLFNGSDSTLCGAMGCLCLSCPLFLSHFGCSDNASGRASAKFDTRFSEPSSDSRTADIKPSSDGIDAFSILESFDNSAWRVDALSASLDSIALEYSIDGGLSDTKSISNLARAFPSLIEIDDVVLVTVTEEVCHVYNLSTTGGWYLSSGIITHNCDCRVVPSWKSFAVQGYDTQEIARRWQDSIDQMAKERAERNGTTEAEERRAIMANYERAASNAKKRNKR